MGSLTGSALRGERLKATAPYHVHRGAALRACRRGAANHCPVNCDGFQLYVGQVPLPTLRDDDILVVDNLASYRRRAVR